MIQLHAQSMLSSPVPAVRGAVAVQREQVALDTHKSGISGTVAGAVRSRGEAYVLDIRSTQAVSGGAFAPEVASSSSAQSDTSTQSASGEAAGGRGAPPPKGGGGGAPMAGGAATSEEDELTSLIELAKQKVRPWVGQSGADEVVRDDASIDYSKYNQLLKELEAQKQKNSPQAAELRATVVDLVA